MKPKVSEDEVYYAEAVNWGFPFVDLIVLFADVAWWDDKGKDKGGLLRFYDTIRFRVFGFTEFYKKKGTLVFKNDIEGSELRLTPMTLEIYEEKVKKFPTLLGAGAPPSFSSRKELRRFFQRGEK